jgi:hypothetical protein
MLTKTTTYGYSDADNSKLPGVLFHGNSQRVHFSKEENELYKILSAIKFKSFWYEGIMHACKEVRVQGNLSAFKQLIVELKSHYTSCPDSMRKIIGKEGCDALLRVMHS